MVAAEEVAIGAGCGAVAVARCGRRRAPPPPSPPQSSAAPPPPEPPAAARLSLLQQVQHEGSATREAPATAGTSCRASSSSRGSGPALRRERRPKCLCRSIPLRLPLLSPPPRQQRPLRLHWPSLGRRPWALAGRGKGKPSGTFLRRVFGGLKRKKTGGG